MANVSSGTEEKVFRIREWYGLNENPDGDTKLKLGEAAVMRNFKITRDGNLQRRPGTKMIAGLCQTYKVEVGATLQTVRTDNKIPGQLKTYPGMTATADGFLEPTGDEAVMSYDNFKAGSYWKYNGLTYSLQSCEHDEAADTYTWKAYEVRAVSESKNQKVTGLWCGNVKGTEYLVGACDGKIWKLHDGSEFCKSEIGEMDTSGHVHMFGYSEKLYLMNGEVYKEWDGTTFQDVEGYRPLVSISIATSGGTLLEQVNKLNSKRRVWISPDGSNKSFQLPETGLASVDYVQTLSTKTNMATSAYTADLSTGTVTFTTAPTSGTNSIEIGYSTKKNDRDSLVKMKCSETFNGANDNRVFLYGDGTNRAFYSGLDYDGQPRADYFPDMNVLLVGEANTPITALIRHYSKLIAYKSNSTYSIYYGLSTLVDDTSMATYYVTPINRSIGNVAMGQAQLVLNSPRTLFGNDLYEWSTNSRYSSNLSADERQARRISDRINATLSGFVLKDCICWDDNDNQEYYVCYGDKALVHNYAADAWYLYTGFPVASMVNFRGQTYVGDNQGRVNHLSYSHRTDNGTVIESYWESGSEPFDREYQRKYSAMLWVGIKPETQGQVNVTVQTDRKSLYTTKVVASSLVTFSNADFRRWSFSTNRKPHMNREKIKAKKFVYYKLVFSTNEINTTVTILNADIRVRFTGYAK